MVNGHRFTAAAAKTYKCIGQWLMVNGQWSMVNGHRFTAAAARTYKCIWFGYS